MVKLLTDERLATFPITGIHIIEASAGSGKTFCLSHIFLRHILQGRSVRQILTVTFTNAAAEELKIRIKEWSAGHLSCWRGDFQGERSPNPRSPCSWRKRLNQRRSRRSASSWPCAASTSWRSIPSTASAAGF